MKVEKKKLGKCQVQLDVSLDAAEMSGIVKKVERAFVREAKLPGFRPGKCPVEIIRREFAESLKQEINRTMFSENIDAAAKEAGLKVVGVTGLKDEKYSDEGGSFTAIVDVEPEFKLPTYKGLKIELKDATVPDDAAAVPGIDDDGRKAKMVPRPRGRAQQYGKNDANCAFQKYVVLL